MAATSKAAGKKKLLGGMADLEFAPELYAKLESKCEKIKVPDEHNIIFFTQRYKFADIAKGASDPAVERAFIRAVTVHNDLAMQFLSKGNAKKCRSLLRESEKLLRDRPNDVLRIKTLNHMAVLKKQKRKSPEALDLLRKAAKIGKRGAKARARAREAGDGSAADPASGGGADSGDQSLAPGMALTELNTCAVLSNMGRHSEAVEHAFEAIRHCEMGLAEEGQGNQRRHRYGNPHQGEADERGELTETMAIAFHNCAVELEYLALRGAQSSKRSVQRASRSLRRGHSGGAPEDERRNESGGGGGGGADGGRGGYGHHHDGTVDPLIDQAVEFYSTAVKIAKKNFAANEDLLKKFEKSRDDAVANQKKKAALRNKRPSVGMRRPSSAPPGRQGKARVVGDRKRNAYGQRPSTSGASSRPGETRAVYTPPGESGRGGSRGVSASSSTSTASHSSAVSSSSSSSSSSFVTATTADVFRSTSTRVASYSKVARNRRPQSAKPSISTSRRVERKRPRSASRTKTLKGRPPFDLRTENLRPQSATLMVR